MIQSESRKRGRPSVFDPEQALEAAMCTFWQHGYIGASVDLISRETAMPRATLYQRFGGKEGLFLAVLDHYAATRIKPLLARLGPEGTLQADLTRFFDAVVTLATEDDRARGCLVSCVLADAAGTHPGFRQELAKRFSLLERRIETRLRHAATIGEQISGAPDVQALLIASVARGLMVRARSGATAQELSRVGRAAAELGVG